MAEGQRGTTLQCMAVCVCVRPEHGWCVVGWWALCHHHQRQHHAVDGVCGNDGATQPSGVTPTHRRVCLWVVWQSLLWRVPGGVDLARVSCCPQQSHGVPCCRWADAPQPLLPFAAGGASLWAGHPGRLAPHVFLCCVERFDFGNKQAHKHTTCGNTTRVGALLVSWQHNLPQVHWCRHPGEMALCVCGCTPRPCVCTRPTHHKPHTHCALWTGQTVLMWPRRPHPKQ